MHALQRQIEERLRQLPVTVALQLPGGEWVGPAKAAVMLHIRDMAALARLAAGQVGALGEAVVEGRVEIQGRMRDLMQAVAGILPNDPTSPDQRWWTPMLRRMKSLAAHTRERDAEQIQFHYDVSDRFYELWLDPRRVYSCAYYRDNTMTLAQAQEAKLDHICRKLDLQPGQRYLDVGCGWGALLLWAAEHYGVQATGITLSRNQHAHVQKLIAERGLGDRVQVLLCDYRDLHPAQPFEKISSVGMFEHVGRANMTAYFGQLMRLLAPGGLVMNHGITAGGLENSQLGAGMGDFIEKYIFPGGELLHVSRVLADMAASGLESVDVESLRPHYARTLWAWSDSLEGQLDEARRILTAGSNADRAERVLRAYRLYLSGSAMSFERGWISLHQILAIKPDGKLDSGRMAGAQSVYPFERGYIYTEERKAAC
ncbi:cyclopropane-fatty-acyl-phospholipid synthase family protein [Xylophilus sp. GOD-11R]|uniref:cyclopropane-fatty-acyl-phospholipid synthase family protein n=1 Tax=Xylophilus sp. GOD-11R TaxID=3089814 RepID=UPI00298BF91C|nr:cyclopropane-fatty-acyl-phospholipid synthase family protein [Xylophilus sp. GOD-11R]WPB56391.1 cyclopropane-fatty-acyl-phospholipid synthase family protein [Xylophilus sp. GOD-11R]